MGRVAFHSTVCLVLCAGLASPPASLDARPFIRGDANVDGDTDLSDGIRILLALFGGRVSLACEDAADVNDDGTVDVSDASAIFAYLFTSGPPPLEPFPVCGEDPTPDTVECDAFGPCPIDLDPPVITCPTDPVKTNDDTPTLRGTGEPSTRVFILEDDAVLARGLVGPDGAWSVTVDTAQLEGLHAYVARVEDDLGNVSETSPPVGVTIDTTPPDAVTGVSILSGSRGSHIRWEESGADDLRGYNVWRKIRGQSDEEYRLLNLAVIETSEFRDQPGDDSIDPDLGPPRVGVTYCYRIQAVDDAAPLSCDE